MCDAIAETATFPLCITLALFGNCESRSHMSDSRLFLPFVQP
jgi:hypothetical protein